MVKSAEHISRMAAECFSPVEEIPEILEDMDISMQKLMDMASSLMHSTGEICADLGIEDNKWLIGTIIIGDGLVKVTTAFEEEVIRISYNTNAKLYRAKDFLMANAN